MKENANEDLNWIWRESQEIGRWKNSDLMLIFLQNGTLRFFHLLFSYKEL